MPRNPFNFDHKKATQTLNYFALKSGGKINKMKALKLIFLADRYHLRKYGRLITDDRYVAMKYGPVPSNIMDIAEADEYLDSKIKDYVTTYIKALDGGLRIESLKSVDDSYFSISDVEALNFAWVNFGHYRNWSLSDFTHNYPEWKKHEESLRSGSKVENIILSDFFEDPENETIDKCYELNDEEREIRRKQLAELTYLEALWR
ncbi:MAG: Panacea domain-containing protein [Dehalococcoidales bacterium]